MSVTVYSRLNELLQQRDLTVGDLERHIDERFGVLLDPGAIDRLMRDAPVRQADIAAIGAVAVALGVEVGELFQVRAIPIEDDAEENISDLNPRNSRRLNTLFAQQDRVPLSTDEQAEMRQLIAKSARHMHERRVRQYAQQRNIPTEQARLEMERSFNEAIKWVRAFESDPHQQREVEKRIEQRKATLVE